MFICITMIISMTWRDPAWFECRIILYTGSECTALLAVTVERKSLPKSKARKARTSNKWSGLKSEKQTLTHLGSICLTQNQLWVSLHKPLIGTQIRGFKPVTRTLWTCLIAIWYCLGRKASYINSDPTCIKAILNASV